MKKVKMIMAFVLAALMLAALVGCSTELPAAVAEEPAAAAPAAEEPAAAPAAEEPAAAEPEPAADEKKVIGISLLYRQDEFYKDFEAALVHEAANYGFEVNLQDANLDSAKQIQQVEDFVSMGVDAIALAPCDMYAIVPAIEEAEAKGVPVFVYDSKIDSDAPTCQVVFDLERDGRVCAEWALEYIKNEMGGKANIALLDFLAEPMGSMLRTKGFREAIQNANLPDVKIVAEQDGEASRQASMEVMENILTAHPEVNLVWGINSDTCAGAKAACVSSGREDVVVVGLGWGIESFEALENNDPQYKCWVVTPPPLLATNTFDAMQRYFNGEEVEKVFEGESFVLDATTIGTYDWRAIVALRDE